jgi:MFS family permease
MRILRRPNVPIAIIALVAGQTVMVLIMTMTPLHMTDHGHDLAAVGLVISGHTFGMFALSPISGRLTDRFGSTAVVLSGLSVVALSAVLSAIAPPEWAAPVHRPLPAGLWLEPRLRRGLGDADARHGHRRAELASRADRRTDLEPAAAASLGSRRRRGRGRSSGTRNPGRRHGGDPGMAGGHATAVGRSRLG